MEPAGPLVALPMSVLCCLFGWAACAVVRGGWREVREAWRKGETEGLMWAWQVGRLFVAGSFALVAVMSGNAVTYHWPGFTTWFIVPA